MGRRPGWGCGSVGDALDNALMGSTVGLYKTELIKPGGPWRSPAEVELATAEWVDWYNTARLHSATGHLPEHPAGGPEERGSAPFMPSGASSPAHRRVPTPGS